MSELSNAVAVAHLERAKLKARAWASKLKVTVYIYTTRHGLVVDSAAPMVADYFWSVQPDGSILKIKRKGF